jgi:hypothetical protein
MAGDELSATLGALADASGRARSIDAEIRALAVRAATEGASYGEIGRALGITRQGARKRFPGLLDAQRPAATSVVDSEPQDDSQSPADRTGGPPQPPPALTTNVVDPVAVVVSGEPEGASVAATPGPLPAARVETAPPAVPTTPVVVPAVGGRPNRPRGAAARPVASRPREASQPRARAQREVSPMDKAVAAAAAMTEDTALTVERTETGYRVLVGDVQCGTLRPDYSTTKRPRWLPMAPGAVSVFPPGRSYPTREEAVRHLISALRHRHAEQRRNARRPRH